MSLHGIMGINLSENMIINNDASNEVTNAQVQPNIMGGLEGPGGLEGVKSDERENSLKSKINKKFNHFKTKIVL